MKNQNNEYFKVMTNTDTNVPEVYMYGFIGQKAEPYFGEDPAEDLTDLAVLRVIKELEQKYSRINIRINSPGGS